MTVNIKQNLTNNYYKEYLKYKSKDLAHKMLGGGMEQSIIYSSHVNIIMFR